MNLEEYYDDIYRYCFFRIQDRSLAEDLTQETFLYTIARNLCIDYIRHTKTRPESVINCDISIFSDAAHSTEGTAFSPTASVSELTDTSIVRGNLPQFSLYSSCSASVLLPLLCWAAQPCTWQNISETVSLLWASSSVSY